MVTPTGLAVSSEHFDDVVLPHLDAAHRLARWLMRNDHDAEDAVQESALRAFRYFRTYAGGNGRAWFLRIVRNTCSSWCGHRPDVPIELFDEEHHSDAPTAPEQEALLLHAADARLAEQALADLPDRFRALLLLREVDALSYQELSEALEIPIGTVMSRLSRARRAFRRQLRLRSAAPKC